MLLTLPFYLLYQHFIAYFFIYRLRKDRYIGYWITRKKI